MGLEVAQAAAAGQKSPAFRAVFSRPAIARRVRNKSGG
jgi:hypothetical protein